MNPIGSAPAAQLLQAQSAAASGRMESVRERLEAMASGAGEESGEERTLRKAAEDFEAVFLSQMLAPMFAGLKTDGLFGGGHAEGIYRAMMIDEMGSAIARSGGIGIADSIYEQLLRLQEA